MNQLLHLLVQASLHHILDTTDVDRFYKTAEAALDRDHSRAVKNGIYPLKASLEVLQISHIAGYLLYTEGVNAPAILSNENPNGVSPLEKRPHEVAA